MALAVDIKRQANGRGSRALSHPSPEGSRAAIVRAHRAPARLCTRCCARRATAPSSHSLHRPMLRLTSSQTMTMGSIVICLSSCNREYSACQAATAKSNASGPRSEDAIDRRPDDRVLVCWRVSVSPLGVTCESDALYVLRLSIYTFKGLKTHTWDTRQRAGNVFCKREKWQK